MKKLAVIGVGNMASAIIGGILNSGLGKASELRLFDRKPEKLRDPRQRLNVGHGNAALPFADGLIGV